MKLINLKEADISLANGGKINGLIQLKQHNFPVPEGWLINQANTLNNLEETQLASLKSQLTSRLRPETTYIVRSSGALEDGAHVSFAGQYTSVRDCRTFDDIWTGIETCIASATAAHVQNYSQQMKITTTDAEFSVLIQEQLEADVSGIAFSMNPISNHDQEMFVEYVKGSGENLANGRLTPKSLTLSWQQTSFDHIQDLQLSSTLLSTLHQTILKAARLFAYPVDLEFCVVGETLYLVQARPITSIQAKVPQGSWTTANFRDGGVAAQACPALMWSLYRDAWQMSLESFIMDNQLLPSQQIPKLALIKYARPYWNVGVVKAAMSRIPGYNEREFDDELGITKTYVGDGQRSYLTPKTVAQLLRVARKIIRTTQNHQANAETLKENLLNQAIAFEQDIANSRQQQASLESIEQLWQAIVCEGQLACETTYFKQVFINTVQLSMKKTSLLKVMSTETFFQLISKLGHISHLRPTVALEAIAKEISRDSQLKAHWLSNSVSDLTQEWRNNSQCKDMLSLTEWLNEFGYHSERELNLQWPSYSEVPEIIIDKILTNITQVSQTTNLQATQSETEIHLRLKAEGFKDRRARALTKDILFLRELLWWREEFKDLSTRYYHLVRQISLLLGTRYQQLGYIESSTDVFYLEKEALQLWMKQQLSPVQLRALIEQNKGYCEAYENYQPMGDLQTGLAQQQSVNLAHDIQLKGIGGNDGIVEAKVRVLTELSQLNELETGEILVTRFTDTGWSHRFGRLAGLITETGGVLSHATIVAREFGLPTIIGAKDATRLLKTGMLIRMNGASGEIQIIKKQENWKEATNMIIGEYGKFVLVTYCGMVLALVAMYCFIHGQVANGMMCFIVSGICDLFDGKVANSFERTDYQKRYGVEIDSLCDMISFAALPAVLILTQLAFNGWSILLAAIYVLAAVTRLATFNADTKNSEKTSGFFIGVPVTYSALVFPLTYLATATWWSEGVQWILPIVALGMAYLFVMNRPVPKPRGKAYLFFCLLALGSLIALWRL